ncbi:hypothetical protein SAMN02910356_01549 [Selenomonas sp. GACV-9]|uniref:polysialyltransferase family glycosyltransferase n=1 Tax=Selenomonas sp. GACV-9 TaxID=3158782 RepID=UPI0008F2FC1A|nr:hypothetical protein SAMN02910356_01549 [Selenomonas ruminantium]
MRILFVCATEYQLLNAISAKLNLFAQVDADIVLQRKNSRELAARLKESGLFAEVCYAAEEALGLHDWLRKFTSRSESKITFAKALCNDISTFIVSVQEKIFGEDVTLNYLLHGYERIKGYTYDEMLAQNNSKIVNVFLKKIKKHKCKLSILEEGIGSYMEENIGARGTLADCAYLYDPRLALYKCKEFKKLPVIDGDKNVLKYANFIFGYSDSDNDINYDNSVILFENGCEKMPEYLTNTHGIKKILLRNPYKKHYRMHERYVKQVECFKKIAQKSIGNVYMKLHPRTASGFMDEFANSKIIEIKSYQIPWELFTLNMKLKNVTMYATLSSAVCMQPVLMNTRNNKYVLLYKITGETVSDDFVKFMEKMMTYYPNVFSIPTEQL